jgi:hypothetical protein
MAVRFGSQAHPSGGLRFGSQTYIPLTDTTVGDLRAAEAGADTFAADSYPRLYGSLAASEAGADALAAAGTFSKAYTMQAVESPTPDTFIAVGGIISASLRFGSQTHPLGGVRFGSQSWAALGPHGSLAATEAGADTAAAVGWLAGTVYSFQAFDVLASFVNYSSESLGAAITGTLDTGNKVMLPVAGPGVAFTWEVNEFGNPSLRLANLTGATRLSNVPWYVWDGSTWTAAVFDVSDAMQGAAFLVETGADTFIGNGSQTRFGNADLRESDGDFVVIVGGMVRAGALLLTEVGGDSFAAAGATAYSGDAFLQESARDEFRADAAVGVSGAVAALEAGGDAWVAVGALSAIGSLAALEAGSDAFSAASRLLIGGNLAAVESANADALSASGGMRIAGALVAAELGADVVVASGGTERVGTAFLSEGMTDSAVVSGSVLITGVVSAKEDHDRFASVGFRSFTGELAAVEVAVDRALARGLARDLPAMPDVDGHIGVDSRTSRFIVRSRQQAAAA